MQELFIPIRFPNLNDYTEQIAKNRHAGGKMKKEWTELTADWCRTMKLGHFTEPVKVHFIWHEPNTKRDIDNVAFAKKFIFDGLQLAGVLTNDNYKWVKGFSDEFVYDQGEGVQIIMTEINYESTSLGD